MKMWFQTAATAPLAYEDTVILAVVVFAVVAPSGFRAKPVETSSHVEAGRVVPL
jgi:hypothetical protein